MGKYAYVCGREQKRGISGEFAFFYYYVYTGKFWKKRVTGGQGVERAHKSEKSWR